MLLLGLLRDHDLILLAYRQRKDLTLGAHRNLRNLKTQGFTLFSVYASLLRKSFLKLFSIRLFKRLLYFLDVSFLVVLNPHLLSL